MNAYASLGGFKVCSENPFHFPECLAQVIRILVQHDLSKEVVFMKRPPDILFVDMQNNPKREIDKVRQPIEGTTDGRFGKLDKIHETDKRRPEFRSLVLGFVLLKAK